MSKNLKYTYPLMNEFYKWMVNSGFFKNLKVPSDNKSRLGRVNTLFFHTKDIYFFDQIDKILVCPEVGPQLVLDLLAVLRTLIQKEISYQKKGMKSTSMNITALYCSKTALIWYSKFISDYTKVSSNIKTLAELNISRIVEIRKFINDNKI